MSRPCYLAGDRFQITQCMLPACSQAAVHACAVLCHGLLYVVSVLPRYPDTPFNFKFSRLTPSRLADVHWHWQQRLTDSLGLCSSKLDCAHHKTPRCQGHSTED